MRGRKDPSISAIMAAIVIGTDITWQLLPWQKVGGMRPRRMTMKTQLSVILSVVRIRVWSQTSLIWTPGSLLPQQLPPMIWPHMAPQSSARNAILSSLLLLQKLAMCSGIWLTQATLWRWTIMLARPWNPTDAARSSRSSTSVTSMRPRSRTAN